MHDQKVTKSDLSDSARPIPVSFAFSKDCGVSSCAIIVLYHPRDVPLPIFLDQSINGQNVLP